eukprot:TRINITY_DN302_c0_g1_i1.p2 TRINITY_DN302_c0_g1~~TRINITY_DN302_c0_g1_i1.p2  ORF type:complete len:259 (-),score=84.00 TRINITY_DN302_c0_g1_i1:218-994(-)
MVSVAGFASSQLFEEMSAGIAADPSVAKKVNGVIQFDISAGDKKQSWTVDLKNKAVVKAGAAEKADLTIIITDENFVALANGKLNPQTAFMKGQIKIKGNMGLAQKLDVVVKAAKKAPAAAPAAAAPAAAAAAPAGVSVAGFKSSALFEDIAAALAADPSVAKKVNGVLQFDVSAGDKSQTWTVDLKNAPSVNLGGPKSGKADATIVIKDDDFIALNEGKLKAQTAFMQGKLKIKGNMALAQKLEVVTQAAKKARAKL